MVATSSAGAVAPAKALPVRHWRQGTRATYSRGRTETGPPGRRRVRARSPTVALVETRSPWSDAPDAPPWAWRYRRYRPGRNRPAFLPLLIAAIQVTGCLAASRGQGPANALDGLAFALLVGGPLALLWRRTHPVLTFAVVQVATVAYLVLDYPRGPFFVAAIVALFNAARHGHRVAAWIITGAGYLVYVLVTQFNLFIGGHHLSPDSLGEYVVIAAWTAVALAIAEVARTRTEHFAEVARTRAEAARARQEQARRQASDERLRIAQELHDVLGHHLSLINVRAGVALHLLDTKPEQARDALGAIKVASSEALREVRTVLATLNGDQAPPRTPAPGLADVDGLAEDARGAGLTVHLRRTGPSEEVPGDVGRATYRIVQEALTNVRRHAGPTPTVDIDLNVGPDELRVRVDDSGVGAVPSTSDGNGIPGMRERAAALGGTLVADARPGGGFRVEARLPLRTRQQYGPKEEP